MLINFVKNIKKQFGFSIMEVIAVLAIVSIGLLGVVTLVIQNIQVQFVNKNALIASQLAQEGLELVKAKRDTNWLSGVAWNTNLEPGNYIIDGSGIWQSGISGINDPLTKLYYQDISPLYAHQTTIYPTNFRRLITISNDVSATEPILRIISAVQYEQGVNKYQYVAELLLYNWGER